MANLACVLALAAGLLGPLSAGAQEVEGLIEFDLPSAARACLPQPNAGERAWVLRLPPSEGNAQSQVRLLAFDGGLVLRVASDGRLDDPLGDYRPGGAGSLVVDAAASTAALVLDPPSRGCERIEARGNLLPGSSAPANALARQRTLAQAWRELDAASGEMSAGKVDRALNDAERGLQARAELLGASHPLTLAAQVRLGTLLIRAGRAREALQSAEKLRPVAQQSPVARSALAAEAGYVRALKWTGSPGKALPLAQQLVVRCIEALGDDDGLTIQVLGELGNLYRDARRPEDGVKALEKAFTTSVAVNGPDARVSLDIAVNYAGALMELGRYDEAAARLEDLLVRARRQFGPDDELSQLALSVLMSTYSQSKQFERALELSEELLQIRTRVYGTRHFRTLFAMRAVAYHRWETGRRDEAIAANRELIAAYREVYGAEHPETLWTMHNSIVYFQVAGRLEEALALAEQVVAAVERQADWNALAPETRQSNFTRYANTYKIKAQLHAQLGQPEAAFATVELTKARTLLDASATRLARAAAITDAADRGAVEAIEARLEALNAEFARARGSAIESARVDVERNRAAAELAALNATLAQRYPRYAQLRGIRSVTPVQLQTALPPRTLFLNYSLEGTHVLVVAVSRERGLSVHLLGERPRLLVNLEALAQRWSLTLPDALPLWQDEHGWFRLQKPGDDTPVRAARLTDLVAHLSAQLVEPLAPLIRAHDQLIVSADGALALVPLEALQFDGQPLIRHAGVSYAPSAAVFWLSQTRAQVLRQERQRLGLIALGGIDYDEAAPSAGTSGSSGRGGTRRDGTLAPLPGSRREVERAAAHLKTLGVRTLLGRQATKSALQAMNRSGDLQRFRFVLLSTHGILDAENPALSAIVLASDPGGDRYVTAADWMTYRLASDLVVASACETARGAETNGEGIVGLPFAFQAAGSARALLTLWRVDDAATARFMDAYFARLARGEGPARALRQVKLQFLASGRHAQPFFWAPFVLFGAADGQ